MSLPVYIPEQQVRGRIVAWGDPAFDALMARWIAGIARFQPGLEFELFLRGSSTAVGGLYTGVANLGLFGREVRRLERTSWKRIFPYQPTVIPIATGSYDKFAKTVAVAVLVNAANPLPGITLRQLDAIYSRERRRGAAEPIRRWGQLGLSDDWAAAPITVYGLDEDTGTAQHIRIRVLRNGPWAVDVQLPAGAPSEMYAGSGGHAADALVAALEADRFGIGFGGFRNLTAQLRALPVADEETDGAFVEGTRESVATRRYALSRSVYAVVNHAPGTAWEPAVGEFLRFVLSREGQAAVAEEGEYLPLTPQLVTSGREQLRADQLVEETTRR